MGFIVNDLSDTGKLIASQLRRPGAGEGQRDGGGVQQLGSDKEKHNNGGETGKGGKGGICKVAQEGGRVEAVRGKLRVAVIGDFLNDHYHIGEATRLSAEVPIPIVKIIDKFMLPGGAGNVARNLQQLGVATTWYIGEGPMPIKNRLMVGDHQLARWDEDDFCQPWEGPFDYYYDAFVVADYGKGSITPEVIEKIKKFKGPIFVDTKKDPSCWSGVATAIFPNAKEWGQFELAYASFDGMVVGKDGAKGLTIYKNGQGVITESPAQARFVRSVNGAGDTVMAAFVYKYLTDGKDEWGEQGQQYFYQNCLDFANAAAAIAVEHPYTYAPSLAEVEERYYNGTESS